MLRDILKRFRDLRSPVKALILLFWIYTFTGALTSVFTQILLYERFTSIGHNVAAMIALFTGVMIGFCVFGYIASVRHINIKQGFAWSFLVTAASIAAILYSVSLPMAYVAMLVNGIGQGLFWLTIHTFELTETHDDERDFYSTVLSSGAQVLSLAGPACATLLIWISHDLLGWGNFTLLFTVAPFVYLLGFFAFSHIRSYRPARIEWADAVHFVTDRRNRAAQPYLLGSAGQGTLAITMLPLVTLFILGNALNVGLYNTAFAIFSSVCLLFIAQYRTRGNRLSILGIAATVIAVSTIVFGALFTFDALVMYGMILAIFIPVMRVSEHVIDLQTMGSIGRADRDFFATMIFRDLSLWLWRSLVGLLLLVIIGVFTPSERATLVIGLWLLALFALLTFVGARHLLRHGAHQ